MRRGQAREVDGRNEPYRRMLLDRRVELLSDLGVKFDRLAALGRVAEEDQAQLYHDEFISLSLNTLEYQQLGLINEALDRLTAGDYGVCLACGDSIPVKRLRAVPWANHCVPCQEREAAFPAVAGDSVAAGLNAEL